MSMGREVVHSLDRALRTGQADEAHMHVAALGRLLSGFRYRYGSEVQLHAVMADVLAGAGYQFEREYRLDSSNRADFWLAGIVIEVKVDGPLASALRQVERYIGLPQVNAVLLASTERWAAAPLLARPAWEGKAFNMIRLTRQAL
jgi:hypothetical protein